MPKPAASDIQMAPFVPPAWLELHTDEKPSPVLVPESRPAALREPEWREVPPGCGVEDCSVRRCGHRSLTPPLTLEYLMLAQMRHDVIHAGGELW